MPAGYCQPLWQGTQVPPGTSGRDFPLCHPAGGSSRGCGLWSAWGCLSGQHCLPDPSSLPTPRAGGEADGTYRWGDGEGALPFSSASPSSPFAHPSWSQSCPVVSGPPGSGLGCFKEPCFQHLLRGEAPRCESGIHLAGTGWGAAICCPIPPSQSREGAGQKREET